MAKSRVQEFDFGVPGMSTTERGAPPSGFILVVEGLEGSGKSWLAMSGPSRHAYFSLNIGADRVIDEWRERGKVIGLKGYEYDEPKFIVDKGKEYWEKLGEKVQKAIYDPFLKDWQATYANDDVRMMTQDRCDEFWELAQRANFGKLSQNSQMAYGPVTDEFINPIKAAKLAGKLVVLIHDIKTEYDKVIDDKGIERSKASNRLKRAGCRHIGPVADAIIRLHYVPAEKKVERVGGKAETVEYDARFDIQVVLNKHDMSLNGQRFEMMELPSLMAMLKPKVSAEVWEDDV